MKKIFYSLMVLTMTALTFTSCEDVPEPYPLPTESGSQKEEEPAAEPTGDGTLDNPFNSVAANDYAKSLGADVISPKEVYIKGIVVSIGEQYSTQYGNASFYISDNGKEAGQFYVFRALYLGNERWKEGNETLKPGDEVIVCGKVTNYKGNVPETAQNTAYLYSLNGKTSGGGGGGDKPNPGGGDPTPKKGTGDGSLNNPFNSVAANSVATQLASDGKTENAYYIKGKICSIANNGEFGAQYGNASFYITDNGSESDDKFYIFRTLYLGNRKWVEGDTQIKVGDEVIVCAKLTNYKGNTPETVQGDTYLYSLNGKTEGGGDNPGGDVGGKGSYDSPYDVASAIAAGSAEKVYLKGYIAGWVEGQVYADGCHFNAEGDNVSTTNVILAPSASETDPAKCMPIQLPKGAIRDGLNLKDNPGNLGKEVILYGDIATYFSVPGFKNTSYAELNGTAIGTKAAAKRRVRR